MSTGVRKEWFLGGGEWTERELVGIERRMRRRGETITDEPIGPRQPVTMTVLGGMRSTPKAYAARTCQCCGETYQPRTSTQRWCSKKCSNRMSMARRNVAAAQRRAS